MTKEYCERKAKEMEAQYHTLEKECADFLESCPHPADEPRIQETIDRMKKALKEKNFLFLSIIAECNPTFEKMYPLTGKLQACDRNIEAFRNLYLDGDWIRFDGDIVITDPCYVVPQPEDISQYDALRDAWDKILEERNAINTSTIYGDWSCHTLEKGSEKVLGQFCADSGMVAVFLLEDAKKFNPNYDPEARPWTATVIKDFHGECRFVVNEEIPEYDEECKELGLTEEDMTPEYAVSIEGRGSMEFFTTQTGF